MMMMKAVVKDSQQALPRPFRTSARRQSVNWGGGGREGSPEGEHRHYGGDLILIDYIIN